MAAPQSSTDRRIDDLKTDLTSRLDEIRDWLRGLPDQFASKEATDVRLRNLEQVEKDRKETDARRQEHADATRRMVYVAIFTAVFSPLIVVLINTLIGSHS